MRNHVIKFIAIILMGFGLILASFLGGFFAGRVTGSGFTSSAIPPEPRSNFDTLFVPFYEAWDLVHDTYLEQPVDDLKLMQGAIRGMIDALGDPFSAYMDPEEYREQNTPLEGEYSGIGAWVDVSGEWLVVISPMPDSPAEKAGLKPNDIFVAVDGVDMTGVTPPLVQKKLLGPEGSQVSLSIKREGQDQLLEFVIQRAVIKIPSLISEIREDGIGYIQLVQFSLNSDKEMRTALETLLANNISGLILDLRNNTGGYVHIAVNIASEFLTSGPVLIEEYGDGTREEYNLVPGGIAKQIPLIVLVNEGSASSSEILAGALQDFGRAILVGTTTFGKGLIQSWSELSGDTGAIRLSIARWLTPKGRQIHKNGLIPDYIVNLSDADIENNNDLQLIKAVELLKEMYRVSSR